MPLLWLYYSSHQPKRAAIKLQYIEPFYDFTIPFLISCISVYLNQPPFNDQFHEKKNWIFCDVIHDFIVYSHYKHNYFTSYTLANSKLNKPIRALYSFVFVFVFVCLFSFVWLFVRLICFFRSEYHMTWESQPQKKTFKFFCGWFLKIETHRLAAFESLW